MGRELKRVPMDFVWPIRTTWGGYLNPYRRQSTECPDCKGSGESPEVRRMGAEWYGNAPFDPVAYGATPLVIDHPAIVEHARRNVERSPEYYGTGLRAVVAETRRLFELFRGQWSHQLIQADVDALVVADRLHDFRGRQPAADEVNAWSINGMGHDSINQWTCVKARCAREGITESNCARCSGEGEFWPSEGTKAAAEFWKREDPPTGDGFQLWETTSEGSPVSPVFATLGELCAWCADHATTFGSHKTTAEQWRKILDADFVCHREGNAVFL